MMKDSLIAIALSSALALAPVSSALAKAASNDNAQEQTAARDFTKISEDGFGAFRDIHLARLALFDGHVDKAKKFVSNAQTVLKKADTDDAAFISAMADLKPPKGAKQPQNATANVDVNQKIKWLPIDAEMALTDEYVVTPENHAAVTKANSQLKQGDRKGAIETLKVAGVDLEYSTVLLPIEQTKTALQSTVKELSSDEYYQANLSLKGIEDSMRVDVVDVVAEPQHGKSPKSAAAVPSKSGQNAQGSSAQSNAMPSSNDTSKASGNSGNTQSMSEPSASQASSGSGSKLSSNAANADTAPASQTKTN